jgi:hypothetical protein
MTTKQAIERLKAGGSITLHQLQWLERRLLKMRKVVKELEGVLSDCYRMDGDVRVPHSDRVEG